MLPVDPSIFEASRSRGVLIFGVIGKRQHGSGESGIVIAVFDPAVADDHEVADPTSWRRRLLRETQRQFIAGIHNYVSVVDVVDQVAHVTVARVVADQIAPTLLGSLNLVV